jgi:imidazolonepropionase-like amidohydrolase
MTRALAVLLSSGLVASPVAAETLVVKGQTLHTLAGATLSPGVVVVEGGRITAVGREGEVPVPDGARLLEAAVVTPGLIDAHSVVGLAGMLNQPHDQDQLEASSPVQPELRAVDAYDAREPLIAWLRGFGVTTLHTGHGPGALVSGETLIAKTRGETVEEAVFVPSAMIAATLGESALSEERGKSPGTRGKLAALLRAELVKTGEYAAKREAASAKDAPAARDLKLEALAAVLAGERPLLVTAQRHQDIMTALRLREEFGFRLVLDGAADAHLLIDEIRRSGVPVIVHPTMARAVGDAENLSMRTAGLLADAGVQIALQSGYESYVPKTRVVLFEAAVAASRGLGFERALAAITLDAARVLGIDDRVGSLEVGKHADLALFDGDPFEYTTHCQGVVIEGEVFPSGH